jgi:hypothetical protein
MAKIISRRAAPDAPKIMHGSSQSGRGTPGNLTGRAKSAWAAYASRLR